MKFLNFLLCSILVFLVDVFIFSNSIIFSNWLNIFKNLIISFIIYYLIDFFILDELRNRNFRYKFKDKKCKEYCVITGGSSGIGLEFAKLFARDGFDLVLISRDKEKLNKASKEIINSISKTQKLKKHKIDIILISKDLSNPNSPKEIFNDLINTRKLLITHFVNCAGYGLKTYFLKGSLDSQKSMIQLLVTSVVEFSHLFLTQFKHQYKNNPICFSKTQRILNIGSIVGTVINPGFGIYGSSKSFVNNFSIGLSRELKLFDKNYPITCSCLAPGLTFTGFSKSSKLKNAKPTNWFFKYIFPSSKPDFVARCGYRAMFRGVSFEVCGIRNKIATYFFRFIPFDNLKLFLVENAVKYM